MTESLGLEHIPTLLLFRDGLLLFQQAGSFDEAGHEMLTAHEYATAIAVFQLNMEFYPTSANVYDSLAEAYMASGNNEKAVEFYRKALAILDQYPDENERYKSLRESIPKQLEKLEQ